MLSGKVLSAIVVIGFATTSCGGASFFGGSKKKKKSNVVAEQTNVPAPATPSEVKPPQIGPTDQILQPDPNTVIFGRDKVFHLGDNKYENTSCKEEITALPLEGNAYFFQFEVLNDNTLVDVNVGKVCGIDYTTNLYEVYSGKNRVQGRYIQKSATAVASSNLRLNKGTYNVVLSSGRGRYNNSSKSDLDDYIVGNVTIKGNQVIRPINYGAYTK
jgi:hypothetical protein